MDLVNTLIKICNQVGCKLGKGFSETVYQEGIAVFLRKHTFDYSKEVVLQIELDGIVIGNVRADIVLPRDNLVIECKAIDSNLKPSHAPQLINYLELLQYNTGILVNFNQNPSKEFVEIVVVSKESSDSYSVQIKDKTYKMSPKGLLIE